MKNYHPFCDKPKIFYMFYWERASACGKPASLRRISAAAHIAAVGGRVFKFVRTLGVLSFAATPLTSSAIVQAADCANENALGVSRTIPLGNGGEIGLKSYPRTLALRDKEVILTFDDGPNPPTTKKILDALGAECVKATFFLIGRNARAAPTLAKREIAEGHTIAHHSFSHPDRTLRGMSEAAAKADIENGMMVDDIAAYGAWSGAPRTPFFRYPGFADTPALNAWLTGRGVTIFGTDAWASDWAKHSPDVLRQLVLNRLEQTRGGIVLFHDSKKNTAIMMPALLRDLKARGFTIAHMTAGDTPPEERSADADWRSETERTILMAQQGKQRRVPRKAHMPDAQSLKPALELEPVVVTE